MDNDLARAVQRLQTDIANSALSGRALDRVIASYRKVLRRALQEHPALAAELFDSCDRRIPRGQYDKAFTVADEAWLQELSGRDDLPTLGVVFELATTVRLSRVQAAARDRMAPLLGRAGDANALVRSLLRWRELRVADPAATAVALDEHVRRVPLAQDRQIWSAYLSDVPVDELPELFEVHAFLGRGVDAVRLARSPRQQQAALAACLDAVRVEDAEAALRLARSIEAPDWTVTFARRLGDLYTRDGRLMDAVGCYRQVGDQDLLSRALERAGDVRAALLACPADQADRFADLVGLCQPAVTELLQRQDHLEAARQVGELVRALERVEQTPRVLERLAAVQAQRDTVLALGRRHFGALVDAATATQELFLAWSRFEEAAGCWSAAAERAEDGNDILRAVELFRQAGRYAEVQRLHRYDPTPEGLAARAASREEGGDLVGAARIYDEAGMLAEATERYFRAERFVLAAGCLLRWRGEEAVEDPRLGECLRRTGDLQELLRICLDAIAVRGADTNAVEELRRLTQDEKLPEYQRTEAEATLRRVDNQAREQFEEHAAVWVREAKATIEARFSRIWGFDLGTSTCAASIYDTEAKLPVPSTWGDPMQFSSTLSVDENGAERVGLSPSALLGVDYITGSKRRIATGRVDEINGRTYRPEQVAASLIAHARDRVELFLAGHVREEIGRRAVQELGESRPEWLAWVEQHHDLRISRHRVIVTIPAYFSNNAAKATRLAGEIAGVTIEKLIREPTAACLDATRERRLEGEVVVADLGGGTLDFSFMTVEDNLYDVVKVGGDPHLGGTDFDAAIVAALRQQLADRGVLIPVNRRARRQLEVAAELLKVELSDRTEAEYTLVGFNGTDVVLRLTRAELGQIIAGPLQRLRDHCVGLRASWPGQPRHLVLVGGPMRSPLIQGLFEETFGLRATRVSDNRLTVASGAAMLGASRDGKLPERQLINDVTPFDIGLEVEVDDDRRVELSVLLKANTTIPAERTQTFTTSTDNQTMVRVQIFNSHLDASTKIGQFMLKGIPPAPRGVQKIDVTFSIDSSGVLEVTAVNTETGISEKLIINDPTLLTPDEVTSMKEGYERQRRAAQLHGRLDELLAEARRVASGGLLDEFRGRLERYRPSPGVPVDGRTQRTLGEMFAGARAIEADLLAISGPLGDLVLKTSQFMAAHRGRGIEAALETGQHLAVELARLLESVRPGLAKLAHWNAVLHGLDLAEPDPLLRFRRHADAEEYTSALKVLAGTATELEGPDDIGRHLHCLAGSGDAEGYRHLLSRHPATLGVTVVDRLRPDRFADVIDAATARIRVTGPDGAVTEGDGFLVSGLHLVTDRELLPAGTTADRVTVEFGADPVAVRQVVASPAAAVDLAVLRLATATTRPRLRLGYPQLLGIGDEVWSGGLSHGDPPRRVVQSAVVDDLRSLGDQLPMIKTGAEASALAGTGPLVTALGEVVGVVTAKHRRVSTGGTFAFSVEALLPLLHEAGFRRFAPVPG